MSSVQRRPCKHVKNLASLCRTFPTSSCTAEACLIILMRKFLFLATLKTALPKENNNLQLQRETRNCTIQCFKLLGFPVYNSASIFSELESEPQFWAIAGILRRSPSTIVSLSRDFVRLSTGHAGAYSRQRSWHSPRNAVGRIRELVQCRAS